MRTSAHARYLAGLCPLSSSYMFASTASSTCRIRPAFTIARVVLIRGFVAGARGGHGRQKTFRHARRSQSCFEIVDVTPDVLLTRVGNRSAADLAGRTGRSTRVMLFHELAEPDPIAAEPD